MSSDPNTSPLNPLPPVVVLLALAILGVELLFQAGNAGFLGGAAATGWRVMALEAHGFYQPLFDWMLENRQIRLDYMLRFITYPFLHGNFTHVIFSLVFILALGKMVGEAFSGLAVLLVFFGASFAGALAYGLAWETQVVLFGAYPAAYGLIGAYSYLLWTNLAGTEENRLRAFSLIGFLMGLQLVWGLLFGASMNWVADLTGFVAGFGLSFVVRPGGWTHLLAKMRQR